MEHPIKIWLRAKKRPVKWMQQELKLGIGTLPRYFKGGRMPETWVIRRIEEITDGEVTINDLWQFHLHIENSNAACNAQFCGADRAVPPS